MGTAYMMSASDIMNELGVKRSKAYDILKDLNEQLTRDGYATVRGKIPRPYLGSNRRDFIAENVDADRTHLNVKYCDEDIKAVYHELFDEAVERYNEKQTRKDRRIDDYYEKIRMGKQEKLFHEMIIQIGNRDDMAADSADGRLAAKILDEYMKDFRRRNPTLRVFNCYLHMDRGAHGILPLCGVQSTYSVSHSRFFSASSIGICLILRNCSRESSP